MRDILRLQCTQHQRGISTSAQLRPPPSSRARGTRTIYRRRLYFGPHKTQFLRLSWNTLHQLSLLLRLRKRRCVAPALHGGMHCTCARSMPGIPPWNTLLGEESGRCGLVHENTTCNPTTHMSLVESGVTVDISYFVLQVHSAACLSWFRH